MDGGGFFLKNTRRGFGNNLFLYTDSTMYSSSQVKWHFVQIGPEGLMHFIGFAGMMFHMQLCQFRIFDPKRAILEDLAIQT